jgi:hypothetical protein
MKTLNKFRNLNSSGLIKTAEQSVQPRVARLPIHKGDYGSAYNYLEKLAKPYDSRRRRAMVEAAMPQADPSIRDQIINNPSIDDAALDQMYERGTGQDAKSFDQNLFSRLMQGDRSKDKRLEHPLLPGDWSKENTSRPMQLFMGAKMNPQTGEMEEIPLGTDPYTGQPLTGFGEQLFQYVARPADTMQKIVSATPGVFRETFNKLDDFDARERDKREYNRKVEKGEIPKPENYDPETSYLNDPEGQYFRNKILKGRAEDYDEQQEDIRAYSMANKKRNIEEVTGNKGREEEQKEVNDYFNSPDRTWYQKNIIPGLEAGGANAEISGRAIGLEKLQKYEKKHPWLANARKLSGPALKSFLAAAAVAQPQLAPLFAEIGATIEVGNDALSTLQAVAKGGATQQKEIKKNEGKKPGEYTGDPGAATVSGVLDAGSKFPGFKVKDGKVEATNLEKSYLQSGEANPLAPMADLSKDFAKNVGQGVENLFTSEATDETTKKIVGELGKGATTTAIAGATNPMNAVIKPIASGSKTTKPQAPTFQEMNPRQQYIARMEELEKIKQDRLAKLQQQQPQQQQVQSVPDEDQLESVDQNYGQPVYDSTNNYSGSSNNQLYSQEPVFSPPQQQQAQQQVPKTQQPQAVTPQVPKQPQAVNPQVPKQPQTAQVKVTPPKQGTQVASVTPATKGYKIQ